MTKEEVLDKLIKVGFWMSVVEDNLRLLSELAEDGLAIRVDKLEPSTWNQNGSYSYVTNDEHGITLAKEFAKACREHKNFHPLKGAY